jgi:hypothetical protein
MASINRILHVYVSLGRLEHACQTLETPPCEVDVKPPEHLETINLKLKIEALTA